MPELFDPIALGELQLDNRIMISPMCQYSAVNGNAGAWHLAHLGSLALSGAGLLCLEATGVSPEGRISPGCLGLWSDENEAALEPVVALVRATAPIRLAIQLSHAGRKAASAPPWDGGALLPPDRGGWQTIAPSALAHGAHEPAPLAMSLADIERVRDDFAAAARRAVRLGFDAIELHGAHGYLLHQFLSPIANTRTDAYGGSLENRLRFPLSVFEAVRAAVPAHVPVGMRVSATDWIDDRPAWDLAQTIVLAHALKAAGADWIDVSSGGISALQKISVGPGYQVAFAQAVREATGMTTMAVGLITEAQQAQAIVSSGQADMVVLGRAMLHDPRWPWRAAAELGAQVQGARQYWRALPSGTPRIFGNTVIGQR